MILPSITLCLALARGDAKDFTSLEKQKYEAFTSLHSFRGHYSVVTTTADGSKMLQDFGYVLGPKGRQWAIVVNGVPTLEYGWNDTQMWRVVYPEKTYVVVNKKDALDVPKFEKLVAKPGEVKYAVTEVGVRFGFESDPALEGPVEEKCDDKDTLKYSVTKKDPAKDAEVTITQWLDKGNSIVRKFEMKGTVKGVIQGVVQGVLLDDDPRAVIPDHLGDLPLEALRDFKRLGSG